MCIVIAGWPGFDVIKFEIIAIFMIKTFFKTRQKSRQTLEYLENEKSFYNETEIILIIVKGL